MANLSKLLAGKGTPTVLFNGTLTPQDLVGFETWPITLPSAPVTLERVSVDENVYPKDIQGNALTGTLENDGFAVGSMQSSTGTDYVSPGATLQFRLDEPLVLREANYVAEQIRSFYIDSSSQVQIVSDGRRVYPTNLETKELVSSLSLEQKYFDPAATAETSYNDVVSRPSMTTPVWYVECNGYAFYYYYDGNFTTVLYSGEIVSGSVSSWTTINSDSNAYKALEADTGKVYWVDDQNIVIYDLQTRTSQTLTGVNPTGNPSNYSSAGVVNGVLFFRRNDGSGIFYYDTKNGNSGLLSSGDYFGNSTSYVVIGAAYNAIEDRYYLAYTSGSNDGRIISVSSDFSTVTELGNYSDLGVGNNTGYLQGYNNGEIIFIKSNITKTTARFANNEFTLTDEEIPFSFSRNSWSSLVELRIVTDTAQLEASDYILDFKVKIDGLVY